MQVTKRPLVSVLMPVYNNLEYLGQAIDSILHQTFDDFELIIVDDGSTQPVWQFLETCTDPRIVTVHNPANTGLAASINRCLDVARGRYLARMDGDDVSLPTRLEEEVAVFLHDDGKNIGKNIGLVSCWGYTITADGRRVPAEKDPYLSQRIRVSNAYIRQNIATGNLILGAASVFSREVFEHIGYFDETLQLAEDYNYWLRLLPHYEVAIVPKELYQRRQHANNMSQWRHLSPNVVPADLSRERAAQFPILKHRAPNP